jgi:transposase
MMSHLSIAAYFPFARFKVVSQNVHLERQASGTLIGLQPDGRCRPLCHDCGQPGTVHSAGLRRMVRDLNLGPAQSWLNVEYRRVWCLACGKAKVEQLGFADPSKRITHRLARYVYELCRLMPVEAVARHLDLNPKTVKAIDKCFLQQDFGPTNYEGLRILAIDEISLSHGQQGYMTVVLDYQTGRVVWVGQGRKAESLEPFFQGMSPQQKQAIEAVAMDMWEAFIKAVQKHCPQARIVFDLFHLVKGYGEVIDEVRREEYRRAHRHQRRFIKGSRYLLLSNWDNLRAEQQDRLEELLAVNQRLSAVYILKDQLKAIYRYHYRGWAKKALDRWCALAEQIEHPLMRRFIGRLRFFEYGILNHCDYPIGTSRLEGVNNKIKVIKRKSYGFHDPEYFALKVKQALPGRQLTTKTG